jgi:hypothetical protein
MLSVTNKPLLLSVLGPNVTKRNTFLEQNLRTISSSKIFISIFKNAFLVGVTQLFLKKAYLKTRTFKT